MKTPRQENTKSRLRGHESKSYFVRFCVSRLPCFSSSRCRGGLTIIETLITIAITAIVILVLTSSILFFYRSNTYTVEQSFAINSARKGIEFMVRDMREATYSDEGAYPVISIGDYTFSFYSDVDRDASVERIRYFVEGTNLKKGVTNSSGDPPKYNDIDEIISLVSEAVRNVEQATPVFDYFDKTGAQITDFGKVTDVAFVRVNVVVNVNPSRAPNEFLLRSSATLRNLKTNL
jgi:type II secretory pathway pseudopilin PulG